MRLLAFAILLISMATASVAEEEGRHGAPQVSYIGFNTLKADHKTGRIKAFHDYIATIKPIMEKYGHTLSVYKVDHNSDPEQPVDFITFGTAPDQQAFGAFFGDKEFQQAFPTLVENIDAHFVTFASSLVVPERRHGGHTMISLDWLKEMDDGARHAFGAAEHKLLTLGSEKGATRTHHAMGTRASTGLARDIAETEAPSAISVWHMTDPHSFLDDAAVRELNQQLAHHTEAYRSFWISPVY